MSSTSLDPLLPEAAAFPRTKTKFSDRALSLSLFNETHKDRSETHPVILFFLLVHLLLLLNLNLLLRTPSSSLLLSSPPASCDHTTRRHDRLLLLLLASPSHCCRRRGRCSSERQTRERSVELLGRRFERTDDDSSDVRGRRESVRGGGFGEEGRRRAMVLTGWGRGRGGGLGCWRRGRRRGRDGEGS